MHQAAPAFAGVQVGVEPAVMGIGPSEAVPKALEQAGLRKEDVAVFELNEAFGSQVGRPPGCGTD